MAEIKTINVTEYPAQVPEEHVLIDVREPHEYEAGHLPGAQSMPLSEFQSSYSDLPTDRAVVIVCKSGGRSMRAAEFLKGTGSYVNIINLDGGTDGWVDAGNPVE
ncbi:MAG: rhodanese-like domain-containing protein [Chloroflexota bacterium]